METGRVSKKTIDNVQFKWHDLYLLLQLLKVLNSNQVNSIAFLAVNKAGKKKKNAGYISSIYFICFNLRLHLLLNRNQLITTT